MITKLWTPKEKAMSDEVKLSGKIMSKTKFQISVGTSWANLINLSRTHITYYDPVFRNTTYSIPYSIIFVKCGTKPRIKVRQVI